MYKKLFVLALVMAFSLMAGAALADEPSATVSMEVVSTSVGIGPTWGQGVLTYKGKTHLFKVKGIEVASVGREKLSVGGTVYHLNKLSDLSGKYHQAEASGLSFISEPIEMAVQNDKGVVINVKGKQKGLALDLTKGGLTITNVHP